MLFRSTLEYLQHKEAGHHHSSWVRYEELFSQRCCLHLQYQNPHGRRTWGSRIVHPRNILERYPQAARHHECRSYRLLGEQACTYCHRRYKGTMSTWQQLGYGIGSGKCVQDEEMVSAVVKLSPETMGVLTLPKP